MPESRRVEDFLELVERARRGRLKLYIGFAAGVGKTFRMLEEAHALKKRGVDVVVAFVETHGRAETAALVDGLELIPRRRIEYRGVQLEEMDLAAVLARAPAIAIVDEIAHTNVPGSVHRKRWQDVLDLLEHGINVIGALNVQHLESLGGLLERETGVLVRETVPDTLLRRADQIVNLDLAVEDLQERLRAGKIYPADKVPWALEHFFQVNNLMTLRELALREVAESLDRSSHAKDAAREPESGAHHRGERVMVAMSSNPPHGMTLLRRGSRMAGRLNTDWFAVFVETPEETALRIPAEAQRVLLANLDKARELGAEVVRLQATDPVPALLDFARSHGVGHVIVGRSTQPRWRRLFTRSLIERLIDDAEGLDVHVTALEEYVMSLRSKLLLALLPLAGALLLLGGQALRVIAQQGALSQRILKDNYRSVLAAQRMKEAIERIDSAMAFRAAGRADKAEAQDAQNRARFASELDVQEHNITEVGEAEATHALRARWEEYLAEAGRFIALGPDTQRGEYFVRMEPAFVRVKEAAERILELNQDAMVRKSEQVRIAAERQNGLMLAATLAAALSGALASVWITAQLLRPLSVLSQAVRRVAQGDLVARADVRGQDEIAQLAGEFNTMASRIAEYRRSSLGELLQAQHASQAAIDSLPDPVVILGNDGALLNVNRAAESLLQLGPGARGDPMALVQPAVRQLLEKVRAHVVSGKGAYASKGFEEALRLDASDGAHYLLPRAEPVYSEDSGIIGAAIVMQDVTRLWRFDEFKNDLVATVAHEFRTPLTSLRMAIHLCVEGAVGPLTEKQNELLHGARQDCERLQDIVDDLLDLARIQAGRSEVAPRAVPASELIERAIAAHRDAAADAGVRLLDTLVEPSPALMADPERVSLVFSNVLGNALRHTPRGSAIELGAAADDGEVRFTVRDHGPGVPREYQQRIFEKFFRVPGTRGEGVGLGLYISREIVRAHGGEMGVDNATDGGARFWFTLPRANT